jgi:hypothetical protein
MLQTLETSKDIKCCTIEKVSSSMNIFANELLQAHDWTKDFHPPNFHRCVDICTDCEFDIENFLHMLQKQNTLVTVAYAYTI